MSHPYVTDVSLVDGQIVLTVEFDPAMVGQPFEISGYATQNGGAFANIYDVKNAEKIPSGKVVAYVSTAPLKPFKNGEDITVVLRASRVWATVLIQALDDPEPGQGVAPLKVGTPAGDGATWKLARTAWVPSTGLPAWNAVQAPAGGANFPADWPGAQAAQPDNPAAQRDDPAQPGDPAA